jgi:cob(I)alamin adenosyltransferase
MKDEIDLKKIIRRLETLQVSVDLVNQDREILEDIQASIRSLGDKLSSQREHLEAQHNVVRAEVSDMKGTVEDKMDEVKKEAKEAVTNAIVTEVAKKKNIVVKSGFFKKFRFMFGGGEKK